MLRHINNEELIEFPSTTVIGSMSKYISTSNINDFQPMNANYGLLDSLGYKHKKKERKELYGKRALEDIKTFIEENEL